MNHPIDTPLPGCNSLEEVEGNYRLDAMQMDLRMRRARNSLVGIKDIEKHFDELKAADPDVYVTYLYARSRLAVVFSDLNDHQLRRAMNAESQAVRILTSDAIVQSYALAHRQKNYDRDLMQKDIRTRIKELLPSMLEKAASVGEAGTPDIEGCSERQVSKVYTQAMLHLRTMMYLRHPVDLLRELNPEEND